MDLESRLSCLSVETEDVPSVPQGSVSFRTVDEEGTRALGDVVDSVYPTLPSPSTSPFRSFPTLGRSRGGGVRYLETHLIT